MRRGIKSPNTLQRYTLTYVKHVYIPFSLSLKAAPEFVPTVDWLTMVLNTLLSISSSNYKTTGQVLQWFLHVGDNPLF